jgi:hypothetical protein
MLDLAVNTLFSGDTPHLSLDHTRKEHAQRSHLIITAIQRIRDEFDNADCVFLRTHTAITLRLNGNYALQRCTAGGWLLRSHDSTVPSYWLPAPATLRRISTQGHILEERAAAWSDFDLNLNGITIAFTACPEGWTLDAVIWRLNDSLLIDELQTLAPVETQGYFLLGSHTRYSKPADLYRHLTHGWIYEDRYAWPHKRRICSENDAHALHLIFSGLQRTTGKRIYGLLKTQLLLSVLSRQSDDGGFRHGEWTEGMESHYRLHCSALHLMMDALSETNDSVVRAALARGIQFISDKRELTNVGDWFYHDELECSMASMQRAPFKWWPGTALGKSPQNMLVLNTQLDTLVALNRYATLTGDTQYAPLVASGYAAAHAVLSLRPMEWLYRLIFSAITLTLLPTQQAEQLPLLKRLWKRIGWQVFVPRLPRIKTRYPRLVMPGGYIDRELSLQVWAYDYLAVNLMDMVRASQGTQHAALKPYIENMLSYCTHTGIAQRWLEHKGRAYAVGFYAEALYLLCRRESRPDLDTHLASALLLCVKHSLGLPPSLLGGNAEAHDINPTLKNNIRTLHPDLIIVGLGDHERPIYLLVNGGQHTLSLKTALDSVPPGYYIPTNELQPGAHLRIEI